MNRINYILFICSLFISLVCSFKNVFVVVVDESAYLSAIAGKGELADYNYDGQTKSIVMNAETKRMRWKVFTDTHNRFNPCKLNSNISSHYNYLITPSDLLRGGAGCAHMASGALFKKRFVDYDFPELSIYFPQNSGDSNWLRKFLYPIFSSPQFLSQTLTIIVTQGKTKGVASALLLGKDAQNPGKGRSYDTSKLFAHLKEYGFNMKTSSTPKPTGPWFDKIFYVVMENQPIGQALKYSHMRNLAVQGTLLTQFYALVNPSQPNYIGLAAGTMMGVTDDGVYDLDGRFIVDLMEEKHVSWKAYMEDFPGDCYAGYSSNRVYVRKHNPFISFNSVRANATLCNKVVNANQLKIDVANNALPRYSFYTPNLDNDGHDTGLKFSSKWLENFLAPLLQNQNFMDRTLVVATYDEGIKPDNRIYTLLLGDMVPYGSLDETTYSTYSLLRTTEEILGLDSLGNNDQNATLIDPANFYTGDLPPQEASRFVFVGVGAGIFAAFSAVGATYYLRVIRAKKAKLAAAKNGSIGFPLESKSFLKDSTETV